MKTQEDKINAFKKKKTLVRIIGEFAIIAGDIAAYGRFSTNFFRIVGLIMMLVGFVLYFFSGWMLKFNKKYRDVDLISENEEIEVIREGVKVLGKTMVAVVFLFSIAIFICGIFFLLKATGSLNKTMVILLVLYFVSDLKNYFRPDEVE